MWSILLCGSSVAKQEANNVFVNGRIYTVDDDNEWVEAVAIRDGKFVAVGSDEQVGNLRGPETKVVDLGGKLVLPGLVDDHLHLDMVSENGMNVTFDPRQNYSAFAGTIRDYLRKNPSSKWVYGGNVDWLQTSNGTISAFGKPSNKSILDGIVSDRPAFFWDIGGHAALVNRKLLQQCGITKDSEPPAGGAYDKDDSGELTGVLRETAAIAMWGAFNQDRPSLEEIAEGVKPVIEKLNSVGITSLTDAGTRESYVRAYGLLDRKGELKMRIYAYITDPSDWKSESMKKAAVDAIQNRDRYTTDRVVIVFRSHS